MRKKNDSLKSENTLVSVGELARYLSVSESMVYKLVEKQGIPHVRIGSCIRFRKDDVDHWLKTNRSKVTTKVK
jgi:excisionase family DNA binding protein